MAPKKKAKPDHISQVDWDAVDSPALTADDFARAKPAAVALPGLVATVKARGRPKAAETKVPVTVRLDRYVVETFKATGSGWQTRINNALVRVARNMPTGEFVTKGRDKMPPRGGEVVVHARDGRITSKDPVTPRNRSGGKLPKKRA
jgi:uncharacterized protein (DUF4415 family)